MNRVDCCDRCLDRRDCARSVRRGGPALCERDIWLPVLPGPNWKTWLGVGPKPAPLRFVRL